MRTKILGFLCLLLLIAASLNSPAIATAAERSPDFDLEISLSDAAAKQMAALSEGISINAFFHGKLSATAPAEIAKMAGGDGTEPGTIELAAGEATIAGTGGSVHMKGVASGVDLAAAYGDNPILLNINVFSARLHSQDNLLDCSYFDDELSLAQKEPIKITCKLIGEE